MVEKKKHYLILSVVATLSLCIGYMLGGLVSERSCTCNESGIQGGSISVSADGADLGVLADEEGDTKINIVAEDGKNLSEGANVEGKEVAKDQECEIRVDVNGAVVKPGVFCLKQGDRVVDALASAGGVNEQVYAFKYFAQSFNQSEPVTDGQKIYVPFYEDQKCILDTSESVKYASITSEEISKPVKGSDNSSAYACTSLNNASQEELELLSGIGESTAQKIIDSRPYSRIEDIMEVKGIGESIFAKIKNEICI